MNNANITFWLDKKLMFFKQLVLAPIGHYFPNQKHLREKNVEHQKLFFIQNVFALTGPF